MKILAKKANFYVFKTYPISLWIFGAICLVIAAFTNYFMAFKLKDNNGIIFLYIMLFLFYIFGFGSIYAAKIEYFTLDKKKGFIKKTELNVFCSKYEHVKYIYEIDDIIMVLKGIKSHSSENSNYFIRFTFKDRTKLEFGKTFSFYEVQKKYRICRALIKGEVILEEAKHFLVKREINDLTKKVKVR